MKNILSIDLDWIMEPSIQIYNKIADESKPIGSDALSQVTAGTVLNANLGKLSQISDFLFINTDNLTCADVAITDSHASLPQIIHQWTLNDNFTIYNVDHHHDCGYPSGQQTLDELLDVTQCGNWVIRLLKQNQYFSKYVWIGNKNSDIEIDDSLQFYLPPTDFKTDISILDDVKFDKVFICKSYAWIPPEYRPLLDSFTLAYAKFINKRN